MILKEKIKISDEVEIEPYKEEQHKQTIDEMRKDEELRPYLYRERGLNIIKYQNKEVGYVFFDQLHYLEDSISITMGLDKKHRSNQEKKGLGKEIVSEIAYYLLSNSVCEAVVIEACPYDERVKKVATGSGFERDMHLESKFYHEGYKEIPYVRKRK